MASFNKMKLTALGETALFDSVSSDESITFTKIKTTNQIFSDAELITLSDFTEKQTIEINSIDTISSTQVKVKAIVSNENLKESYYIETIGLFAKNKDDDEYLFSITTAKVSDYMPAFSDISLTKIFIDLLIKVTNAENVKLETTLNGYVYEDDYRELKSYTYSNIEDIRRLLIPQTANKNFMINSNFQSQVTGFTSNVTVSGTTRISDMITFYAENDSTTYFYKGYNSSYKSGYLKIVNTKAKIGLTYLEMLFHAPQELYGEYGTLSFKVAPTSTAKAITVQIIDGANVTEQFFNISSLIDTYEVTSNFQHRPTSNLYCDNPIKVRFIINDNKFTMPLSSNLEIYAVQYEKGIRSFNYIQKSQRVDDDEVSDYFCAFPKLFTTISQYYSTYFVVYQPIKKATGRIAYLRNLDIEGNIRFYRVVQGNSSTTVSVYQITDIECPLTFTNNGFVKVQVSYKTPGYTPNEVFMDSTTSRAYIEL